MVAHRTYFENYYPSYQQGAASRATSEPVEGVFCPAYARGGLGGDYLLGGHARRAYRVIDLSGLELHVTLDFTAAGAGIITDGIDSIVFQQIEEIILPSWMRDAIEPSLQACSDHGVRLRLAEHEETAVQQIAAE